MEIKIKLNQISPFNFNFYIFNKKILFYNLFKGSCFKSYCDYYR